MLQTECLSALLVLLTIHMLKSLTGSSTRQKCVLGVTLCGAMVEAKKKKNCLWEVRIKEPFERAS